MTQPLVPAILPALDTCRTIEGRLGMRVYTVTVRQRIWTGERPGIGASADFDTPLVNVGSDGFTCPVHVRELSRNDIIASGGLYISGDLRVGPMTPAYQALFTKLAAGYTDQSALDPKALPATAVEMIWFMTGPSLAAASVLKKLSEEATSMHYYVVVRLTGERIVQ
jgi:hypothetical protein